MTKISPHLWYTDKADEAAAFYASIFPDACVDSVTAIEADNPSGPAGSVKVVEFTLCSQSFLAIGAGDRTAVGHMLQKFRIPTEKDPRHGGRDRGLSSLSRASECPRATAPSSG